MARGASFVLLTIFVMAYGQLDPVVEEQIDRYIEDVFLPSNNIPGMTLAVLKGTATYLKGYGYRNLDQQIEANENTLFAIGSISKVWLT